MCASFSKKKIPSFDVHSCSSADLRRGQCSARRCDCDGRVNEHEFDIWLLLFGIRTKWNEHGSRSGIDVFAGDADSDRGSLRILSVADRSVGPYG
jgi:hypothetical protein